MKLSVKIHLYILNKIYHPYKYHNFLLSNRFSTRILNWLYILHDKFYTLHLLYFYNFKLLKLYRLVLGNIERIRIYRFYNSRRCFSIKRNYRSYIIHMYGHCFCKRQNSQVCILSNNFIIHTLNNFKYYKFLFFYLLIKFDIQYSSHYRDYVKYIHILLIPN